MGAVVRAWACNEETSALPLCYAALLISLLTCSAGAMMGCGMIGDTTVCL
jgi:hypothetical protein